MAVSSNGNYYPRLILSIISCFFSCFMIINILFVSKLRRQFYQLLCGSLALADLIQCLSIFIADNHSSTYQLCTIQEYILQGACLLKAFITVIICSLTWSIIHRMEPLKPCEFIIHISFWMFLPILCLSISVFSNSAHYICSSSSSSSSASFDAISYMVSFLLPICFCISINTIYYINMRYQLLIHISPAVTTALLHQHHYHSRAAASAAVVTIGNRPISLPANKVYQLKLLRMIRKLKYYPLIFSVGWILEIISTLIYLITGHANKLLSIFSAVGITSIGIGIAMIYFYHQKVYPSIFLNILSVFTILFRKKKRKYSSLISSSSRPNPAAQESFLSTDDRHLGVHGSTGASSHGYQNRSSILSSILSGTDLFRLSKGKCGYETQEEKWEEGITRGRGGEGESGSDGDVEEEEDDEDDVNFVSPTN
jgi:hypothetical protein